MASARSTRGISVFMPRPQKAHTGGFAQPAGATTRRVVRLECPLAIPEYCRAPSAPPPYPSGNEVQPEQVETLSHVPHRPDPQRSRARQVPHETCAQSRGRPALHAGRRWRTRGRLRGSRRHTLVPLGIVGGEISRLRPIHASLAMTAPSPRSRRATRCAIGHHGGRGAMPSPKVDL